MKAELHVLTLAAAMLLSVAAIPGANAESIWARRQKDAAFLYADDVASDVGDSLTVLIADESSFNLEGERESEKTTAHSGRLNIETAAGSLKIPAGTLEQESSRTLEGSDEHTGSRQFSDSITVTVEDRLPNGNLVIAGRKERVIAGEQVVTTVNGIVRPEEVSGANTVSSRLVAHLKLYYETHGTSNAYVREGWLNRIISAVWPF
ncbi:MAG: flagellar basal body L-ring protein FlgH [Candidatus Brocadiia bacterium]